MDRIDIGDVELTGMSRRSAEKWENDLRRNRDPNYLWTDANHWDKV